MAGFPLPVSVKLIIAIAYDGLDFLFGWIPIAGTLMDLLGTALAVLLFGTKGLIYFWEVIAFGPGNVIDAFIPTMTLLAIWDMGSAR